MLTDETQATTTTTTRGVCPLDGAIVKRCIDGFYVCTRCCEMLTADETVPTATIETRAAHLAVGDTDTDPDDAPVARMLAA